MNKEEARKKLILHNIDRDVFRHILDSIDAIEKRLEKLENMPVNDGNVIHNPPPVDEMPVDSVRPKPQKKEYRTLAEHIEMWSEGMTEEEARQDFIERSLANLDRVEMLTVGNNWVVAQNTPAFVCTEGIRLPLDAEGELPDYPLLACPDVDGEVKVNAYQDEYWVAHTSVDRTNSVEIFSKPCKTKQAAKAMNNKWMRKRFGVSYGEGE